MPFQNYCCSIKFGTVCDLDMQCLPDNWRDIDHDAFRCQSLVNSHVEEITKAVEHSEHHYVKRDRGFVVTHGYDGKMAAKVDMTHLECYLHYQRFDVESYADLKVSVVHSTCFIQ